MLHDAISMAMIKMARLDRDGKLNYYGTLITIKILLMRNFVIWFCLTSLLMRSIFVPNLQVTHAVILLSSHLLLIIDDDKLMFYCFYRFGCGF